MARITDRALLRLHVEAVWGIQLPPLTHNDVELLPESVQPSWKLYVADLGTERIFIWRRDISIAEREALHAQVDKAVALPALDLPGLEIEREVALSLVASPKLALPVAMSIARSLTTQDRTLLDEYNPGSYDYHVQPAVQPLIGVVVANRLLSLAHSSRRTTEACELGIDTLAEARQRGYALAATIVWTQAILQEGLVPLYSADASNIVSLRLAAAAGYRTFANGTTFTRIVAERNES